ncbi:hypothetical protein [Streptomyces sp. NPDC006739]|uniref:hypothetical protein n=1 Tax=Streptomyces sp. NPDC006739 TaxID=3364763 RepID=UPI0036892CC3
MPPRKRATAAPESVADDQQTDGSDARANDDAGPGSADTAPGTENSDELERSELQAVDEPCTECFPRGWPDHSFAVGCEHGTWTRD